MAGEGYQVKGERTNARGTMKIFYGAAIQGAKDRSERSDIHCIFIDSIKSFGYDVITEHTKGKSKAECKKLLELSIGRLPEPGFKRSNYIRNEMIKAIEGDIAGAIFEVSTPSLGTGIEIAHTYMRPCKGLEMIPILVLYEKEYWPNKLSSMIRGIDTIEYPNFSLIEYSSVNEGVKSIKNFLSTL